MVYQYQSHRKIHLFSALSLILALVCIFPASAEDFSGSVIGRYDDWNVEDAATVGLGIFPTVTIEPKDDTTPSLSSPSSQKTGSAWVTISPFTASLSGQETFMIVGYLSGVRNDAVLTIQGRGGSDSDYSDLTTLKPDENGLFVWAVPATYQHLDLFRVNAKSGTSQYLSNAIRFTDPGKEPVIKPVITPVQTIIPMQTAGNHPSSLPVLTQLTISAQTMNPKVGEDVVISGRLTDQDGKGISGATIGIDETGYPGASGSDPFATVVTGSDGRFETSLSVMFSNSVGLVASFEGDDTYRSAESNTLFFVSHE